MADQWYYTVDGRQTGPVSAAELKKMAVSGRLKPSEYIWRDGFADWVKAKTLKALFPEDGQVSAAPLQFADSRGDSRQELGNIPPGSAAEDVRETDAEPRPGDAWEEDDDDRPRRKRNKQTGSGTLIGVIVGVMVLVGGIVTGAILLLRSGDKNAGPANEQAVVDAVTLVREYQTDRNAADQKYKGKTLLVQGPVIFRNGAILHLETELPSILPGVQPGTTDQVLAKFTNVKDCAGIAPGAVVQVQGECKGFNHELDVELHHCKLVKQVGQLPFKQPQAKNAPKFNPPKFNPPVVNPPNQQPVNPPVKIVAGKEVFRVQNKLSPGDAFDKRRANSYCKIHTFRMNAGKTYVIDLMTNIQGFDPYLRLEDSQGKQLAEDDDGGGFPNARIFFTPAQDDDYRLIATTFGDRQSGSYTLTVREKQ
ncbi:MAG: DUF4339 domain-containing protein [Planctomycetes bacterium]|nr:DUF4339 domain-containing protein [Planctomycetota bacterium]